MTFRTKLTLIAVAAVMSMASLAQAATRYQDRIFSSSTSNTVTYATATNVANAPQALQMTIYQPSGDAVVNRPAVLVFFGGGFVSGAKTDANVVALCDSLTARGYVAIAADYRIGVLASSAPEVERAVYRATQDVKAAIRYVKANHISLGVDPARVYAAGFSAGAIASVLSEFWDQSEVPTSVDPLLMGTLDASGNTIKGEGKPAGILSVAGGIPSLSWMSAGNKLLAMAHSGLDIVVPCSTAPLLGVPLSISGSCAMLTPASNLGYSATLHALASGHLPTVGGASWSAMVVDLLNNRLYPNVVSNVSAAPQLTSFKNSLIDSRSLAGSTVRIKGSGLTGATAVYFNAKGAVNLTVDGDTVLFAQLPFDINETVTNLTVSKNLISANLAVNFNADLESDQAVWTGAVSTDWMNPANWSGNVLPTINTNVTIEAGTNPCVLSTGQTGSAFRLLIGYTANFTMATGADLKFGSTVAANSLANLNTGARLIATANFANLYSEPLSRGGTTYFPNVRVQDILVVLSDIHVKGTILMESPVGVISVFTPGAKVLYLESGLGYQGKIVTTGAGQLLSSSLVKIQADIYVPGNTPAWYNLGVPLEGQTLQNLQSNVVITGSFPGATPTHNPSVYFYDPTVSNADGYVTPTNITNALPPTKGIRAWLWPSFFAGSDKLSFTGTFDNTATMGSPLSLSYCSNCLSGSENGFNLIGNPALADIRFSSVTKNNAADMYWVANKGVFAQWNGTTQIGTNGANGRIALGQAFFVKALGNSASINIGVNAPDTSVLTPSLMRTGLRQTLRVALNANGYATDEIASVFANGFNDGYNAAEESDKMVMPNSNAVSFVVAGKDFGIQAQSEIGSAIRVLPITIRSQVRNVSLVLTEFDEFGTGTQVYLIDRLLQSRTLLQVGQALAIQLQQLNEVGRFELEIVPGAVTSIPAVSSQVMACYPNPAKDRLTITGVDQSATIMISDLTGRDLGLVSADSKGTIDVSGLANGAYQIKVVTADRTTVLKFMKQ